MPLLASFLRKSNRALKLATLELLTTLLANYGNKDFRISIFTNYF